VETLLSFAAKKQKLESSKVLVTKTKIFVFKLRINRRDYQDSLAHVNTCPDVSVIDMQEFDLMDFEFMQPLTFTPRAFVIQTYNKTNDFTKKMP